MNAFPVGMTALACAVPVAAAGCAKQQTAGETQVDVAKAQAQGARDASEGVNKAEHKAALVDAAATSDVTVAEAAATHYTSIVRCEALAEDARAACKSTADARQAEAKAHAATTKANAPAT